MSDPLEAAMKEFSWWMYSVPAGHIVILNGPEHCEPYEMALSSNLGRHHYATPQEARRMAAAILRQLACDIEEFDQGVK